MSGATTYAADLPATTGSSPGPSDVSETAPLFTHGRDAESEDRKSLLLPTPILESWARMEVVLVIGSWMVVSSAVIVFNKWVFTYGNFSYPLLLTSLHMWSCFFALGAVRKFAPTSVRTMLMPRADVDISWSVYFKYFFVLSVLYSTTIGCGNVAYLYLSIAFIQMMKPLTAMFSSLWGFAFGTEVPTATHMISVSLMIFGVTVASNHSPEWHLLGVCLQLISSCAEGARVCLFQTIVGEGLQLDPVTSVYHFSYGSGVLLGIASLLVERARYDFLHMYGSLRLVLFSCLLAVALNAVIALAIKKTSGVTVTVCGILKDIGLVFLSTLIFQTPISRMQSLGYTISLLGVHMYKTYKDNLEHFQELGFVKGMATLGSKKAKSWQAV